MHTWLLECLRSFSWQLLIISSLAEISCFRFTMARVFTSSWSPSLTEVSQKVQPCKNQPSSSFQTLLCPLQLPSYHPLDCHDFHDHLHRSQHNTMVMSFHDHHDGVCDQHDQNYKSTWQLPLALQLFSVLSLHASQQLVQPGEVDLTKIPQREMLTADNQSPLTNILW